MGTLTQYDSIEENIPHDAQAVAGYVSGSWPTFHAFERDFPHLAKIGRVISIAVQADEKARCLDVEAGDAEPYQAPGWYRNHADKSEGLPWLYASAANVESVIRYMGQGGIARSHYYVWSAHYSGRHICSPSTCGYPKADGTQYDSTANGINLDASEIEDYCYRQTAKPKPYPIHRFSNVAIPVPRQWRHEKSFPRLARNTHLREREVVRNYLRLKNQKHPDLHWLFTYEQELLFFRKLVWTWAHTDRRHGKPSWGVNWRGWRWAQLDNWTKHVHQAW